MNTYQQTAEIKRMLEEVKEWSSRCFKDKQANDLGVAEELGEATHCVLKRFQGIRGFDNDMFFLSHFGDALADMGIYMLNYAAQADMTLRMQEINDSGELVPDRVMIAGIMRETAILIIRHHENSGMTDLMARLTFQHAQNQNLQLIWNMVDYWASRYGIDFLPLVIETWAKVKQRDWKKNHATAHLQEGQPPSLSAIPEEENTGVPHVLHNLPPAAQLAGDSF